MLSNQDRDLHKEAVLSVCYYFWAKCNLKDETFFKILAGGFNLKVATTPSLRLQLAVFVVRFVVVAAS